MSRRRNKYYDRKLKLQAVQDYLGGGGSALWLLRCFRNKSRHSDADWIFWWMACKKKCLGVSFCGDTLFNRQSYFIDFFFSKRVQGPKNQPGSSAQDQRKRDGTEDDAVFDALRLLRCSSNKSCYRQHISRDCPPQRLGRLWRQTRTGMRRRLRLVCRFYIAHTSCCRPECRRQGVR